MPLREPQDLSAQTPPALSPREGFGDEGGREHPWEMSEP